MSVLLIILGFLLFVGLVVFHEFGHFLFARRGGVEVEEFGIGFPPKAKTLARKNGTEYTLNWLPLGGFVRLKGENDSDNRKGSFGAARLRTKVAIMLAGVGMNLLAAAAIFTVLAATGMPKIHLENLPFYSREQFTVASDTKIVKNDVAVAVSPASPAAKAGLKDGDIIRSVGETNVTNAAKLPEVTGQYKGQKVAIVYERDGAAQTTQAQLNPEKGESGILGVVPIDSQVFRATWSAPVVGVATTAQYVDVSFRGLGHVLKNLFTGEAKQASESVGGPVATAKLISDQSKLGLTQIMFVIALISVSLAVFNVLPIPALDGGRLFVMLLFRAIKKPLTKEREEKIHGTGFALLMVLFVLVTVLDFARIF